jgi:hypothetical protein
MAIILWKFKAKSGRESGILDQINVIISRFHAYGLNFWLWTYKWVCNSNL